MHIVWSNANRASDWAVTDAVRAALGTGEIRFGRLCPVCGAVDHGCPWATHDGYAVPVSLSRAGGHLLVVVAPDVSSVGVDVEAASKIERNWPTMVVAPGERADSPQERLALWVAKEAILKANGTGLTVPMGQIVVADFDGELVGLEAPAGFGAALALRR
ncbi:MAG: 4'-phosphopantetheinyl transferase family protein [Marmoricola sp.]